MSVLSSQSVAIIIAAFDAQATIGRAIASALAEPEVTEVIVVDDASSDGTLHKAQSADDGSGRLKVIGLEKNGGPSQARNKALALSNAAWVGVLDADDYFVPGRIAALLAQAENADLIADDMWQVKENDVDTKRTALLSRKLTKTLPVSFTKFVASTITRTGNQRGELSFIKPLMRRSLMEKYSVHYQEAMRLGEDFELYTRLLGFGARLMIIPNRGYVSVMRANSLSSVHSVQDLQCLRDCHDALQRDLDLTKAQRRILTRHRDSIDGRLQWRRLIEAVKIKQWPIAFSCFRTSWYTRYYLIRQLSYQAYLRLRHGHEEARTISNEMVF